MIYSINLSKDRSESDFEKFMLTEIFPAVDKRALRHGQVTGLVLLKGNTTDRTKEYLWLVYGTIGGGAAGRQIDKINAFGARVSPMFEFEECGRWFAYDEGVGQEQALPT